MGHTGFVHSFFIFLNYISHKPQYIQKQHWPLLFLTNVDVKNFALVYGMNASLLLQDLLNMIMGSTLVKCAVTDLAIQWVGWALASAFKTEKFYDLAGK